MSGPALLLTPPPAIGGRRACDLGRRQECRNHANARADDYPTRRLLFVPCGRLARASLDASYHANAEPGELLELAPVGALERYRLPAAPTGQTCLPLLACEQLDCVAPERFGEALRRVTGQVRRIAHVGGAGQELRLL